MKEIFYIGVFPGFIFSLIAGAVLSWFDRKVTAWVQFRKGPPFLQPFYDLGKLMNKETILPRDGGKVTFLVSPVLALCAAVASSVMIFSPALLLHTGFSGDILVIIYLLAIPSIAYMVGAAASANPLAIIGASREMKLMLSYELAFLLILATVAYKSGMTIRIADILSYQSAHGALIGSFSGVLLFIAALLCIQAKLGLVPFDVSEAETEITHGIFIEYSGLVYFVVKLARYVMLYTLSSLLVILFLGGFHWQGTETLWSVLKLFLVVLLLTLIRNTNPRVRLDQSMRFFFIWVNLGVLAAFALSLFRL